MKVKRIISLLLLVQAWFMTSAQFVIRDYSNEGFQQFLTTTTLVMKTGDEELDADLLDAFTKYWKVTPFELKSKEFIEQNIHNEAYSFIMPVYQMQTTSYAHVAPMADPTYSYKSSGQRFADATQSRNAISTFHSLCLLDNSKKNMNHTNWIAYAPFNMGFSSAGGWTNYFSSPFININLERFSYDQMKTHWYRMKDAIAGLNKAIELQKEFKYEFKSFYNSFTTLSKKHYDPLLLRLKEKTLYILMADFSERQKEKDIQKVYPYKFKLVGINEMTEAVKQEQKDIVYLSMVRSGGGGMILTDPSTHECIGAIPYQDVSTIDAGDLKQLANLIEKAGK